MPALSKEVKELIELYDLEEHPEGGYFTETYRADQEVETPMGIRSASTAIKFLVTKNSVSRLHRIESDGELGGGGGGVACIQNSAPMRSYRIYSPTGAHSNEQKFGTSTKEVL